MTLSATAYEKNSKSVIKHKLLTSADHHKILLIFHVFLNIQLDYRVNY